MPDRSAASELAERAMRSVLLSLSHRKSLGRLATKVPVTRRMVGRFVAGETMEEALPAIERLHDQGMRTTVDVLGESVTAEVDARAACADYLALLDALPPRGLDLNVSLKPSQMGAKIDEALAARTSARSWPRRSRPARSCASTWRTTRYTDRTLACGASCARSTVRTATSGVVIQAALRRSEQDVER